MGERVIKFRARMVDGSKWVIGGGVWTFARGTAMFGEDERKNPVVHQINPKTVGQFTGLKDRNGKEIYEGDIVRQNACYSEAYNEDFSYDMTYIGVVRIEASKGVVIANITCTDNIDENIYKVKHRKGVAGYRAEVIGNIYENPELLKG